MSRKALLALVVAVRASAAEPTEIGDMLRSLGGTWKCEGSVRGQAARGSIAITAVQGGAWVKELWVVGDWKRETYTTFENGKWFRMVRTNDGGHAQGTSDGMRDMKMDFAALGDHIDAGDLRRGLRVWGNAYDLTCKR